MSETKDQIAEARDALRAENEPLRGQLAAAGVRRGGPVSHEFVLSEGERQELLTTGVTTHNGVRLTREDVERKLTTRQADLELGDVDPAAALPGRPATNIPGFDYVYPSVQRGAIDPAVAGTPGINGPAAGSPDAPPVPASPVDTVETTETV